MTLLQRLLGIRETGTFDQPTRRAVIAYQKARQWLHPATGGVGPKTWESLDSGRDATSSDQPEGTPGDRPSLDLGDQGPGVKLLQRCLGIAETGTFDEDTRKAVVAFQEQALGTGQGSGGVGPMTWKALEERARKPPSGGTLVVGGKVVGKVTNFRLVTGIQATPQRGAGGTVARRVLAREAAEVIEEIAEGADAAVEGAPISAVRVIVAAAPGAGAPSGFLAGVPAAAVAGVFAAGFLVGLGGGALVGFVIMHAQEVEGVPKRPYEEYPGTSLPGGAPPPAATQPTSPQPEPAPTPQSAPTPQPQSQSQSGGDDCRTSYPQVDECDEISSRRFDSWTNVWRHIKGYQGLRDAVPGNAGRPTGNDASAPTRHWGIYPNAADARRNRNYSGTVFEQTCCEMIDGKPVLKQVFTHNLPAG